MIGIQSYRAKGIKYSGQEDIVETIGNITNVAVQKYRIVSEPVRMLSVSPFGGLISN